MLFFFFRWKELENMVLGQTSERQTSERQTSEWQTSDYTNIRVVQRSDKLRQNIIQSFYAINMISNNIRAHLGNFLSYFIFLAGKIVGKLSYFCVYSIPKLSFILT